MVGDELHLLYVLNFATGKYIKFTRLAKPVDFMFFLVHGKFATLREKKISDGVEIKNL